MAGHMGRKLAPLIKAWEWQVDGACRRASRRDKAAFFHPDGERGPKRTARAAHAKAICEGCPVLEQCRQHALTIPEPYGTWGGLSERELRAIIAGEKKRRKSIEAKAAV